MTAAVPMYPVAVYGVQGLAFMLQFGGPAAASGVAAQFGAGPEAWWIQIVVGKIGGIGQFKSHPVGTRGPETENRPIH
jgi:hypothetical protein